MGDKSKERGAQCPYRPEFCLRFVCKVKNMEELLAVYICKSDNVNVLFHNKNGGMVEMDLRSDFMLSTACYFKCQSLGGGSRANNFLQRLDAMKVGEHTPNS